MFEINLIRDRIVSKKRKHLAFGLVSLYVLIWSLTIMVAMFLYISNVRTIKGCERALAKVEESMGADYPGRMTSSELEMIREKYRLRIAVISKTLSRRILWAPKLDEISNHLPERTWIDQIYSQVDTTSTVGKRFGILVIEGSVLRASGRDPSDVVQAFISGLSQSALFMEGIESVELAPGGREVGSMPQVATFRVLCEFSQGRGL